MKQPRIALIDYDMGNLRSVAKALEKAGCAVTWADRPSQLKQCDGLVLPGVGAFSEAVKNLNRRKLTSPIKRWIKDGRPFLGICLGYQLLFEKSAEGAGSGFGIFKGRVRLLSHKRVKVPHMGWNRLKITRAGKASPVLRGIPDGAYFYFVHSYVPDPRDRALEATSTDYGGRFSSSVAQWNLFAAQFHPEKSGPQGLKVLKNFARLSLERGRRHADHSSH